MCNRYNVHVLANYIFHIFIPKVAVSNFDIANLLSSNISPQSDTKIKFVASKKARAKWKVKDKRARDRVTLIGEKFEWKILGSSLNSLRGPIARRSTINSYVSFCELPYKPNQDPGAP